MRLVIKNVEEVKKFFLDVGPNLDFENQKFFRAPSSNDYFTGNWSGPNRCFTRLRLDWEILIDDSLEGEDFFSKVCDVVFDAFVEDLEDLIQNGDYNDSKDALYKSMDGAKKRGKQPKKAELASAQLHQHIGKRDGNEFLEYTLYTILYTEW